MFVKNYMSSNLITITPDTTVIKALDLMREHDIHRLPVVVNGQLQGLVTESIIAKHSPSTATSLSVHELNYLLNKTTAQDIMIKQVVTVAPDALLEQAAVLMRTKNLGVLVVVEDNRPVGIITDKDVFDAFIDVSGYFVPGTRIVIELQTDRAGIMEDMGHLFNKANLNVPQIALYHVNDSVQMVLHVDTQDGGAVRQQLEAAGYKVTSVVVKPE
ncbi:CBS domain-containing protein [Aerococcaceae bacterium NML210727]|nr:CBS domain-containing protein [Aerococcaceae bacterium NML210727]MCW6655107.1 CBS domain-containing protein [Aerococcaceae bacterium NML201296]